MFDRYSLENNAFFQLTLDNRVTLWDVATGAVKVQVQEKNHLGANYTCAAYRYASVKKQSRKSTSSTSTSVAAVGNTEGAVLVWDMLTGEFIHSCLRLPAVGSSEAIADVAFSNDGSKLYICTSRSKYVFEIDVKSGNVLRKFKVGKQGACKLCVSPDDKYLITASTNIRMWDLKSGDKSRRYVGHSSPVTGIVFGPDSKYFFSFCEDRFVSMWSTTDGESESAHEPVASLSVASTPVSVSTSDEYAKSGKREDASMMLSVFSQDKLNNVWLVDAAKPKNSKKVCTIHCSPSASNGHPVVLQFGENGSGVVARETPLRPVFETVTFMQKDEFVEDILLADISKNSNLISKNGSDVTSNGESSKAKSKVHIVGAEETQFSRQKAANLLPEDENDTMTLGERVEKLNASLAKSLEESERSLSKKRPRDASHGALSTVLEQALQSNDGQMLEICLGQTDEKIVSATVRHVSPTRIVEFINSLVNKFENRPARGWMLLVWIKAILEQHASYLMQNPESADSLANLYRIVESRTGLFDKFLRLQGRLDFVMSQSSHRDVDDVSNGMVSAKTAVVYDEEAPMEDTTENHTNGESRTKSKKKSRKSKM